jgi:hypothetical protein
MVSTRLMSPSRFRHQQREFARCVCDMPGGAQVDQLQHLQQRLLDQPIRDRRDAELALACARLRDRYPSYRTGPLRPLQQLVPDSRPRGDKVASGLFYVQSIDPRRPFIGFDTCPRSLQVLSRQNRRQQP